MNSNLEAWLEDATLDELKEVSEYIEKKKALARRARFDELTQQALTALRAIEKEFPCAEILISHDDQDINILDYTLSESDFMM